MYKAKGIQIGIASCHGIGFEIVNTLSGETIPNLIFQHAILLRGSPYNFVDIKGEADRVAISYERSRLSSCL